MLSAACFSTRNPYSMQRPASAGRYTQDHKFPVVIERRSHPFPFRTRQLSSASPMILRGQLRGKVGRRRDNTKAVGLNPNGLSLFPLLSYGRHCAAAAFTCASTMSGCSDVLDAI